MERDKERLRTPTYAVALFLLSIFILLPFAGNYFVSDDFDVIKEVSSGGPFAIWSHAPSLFLRPLVTVSMWLNHAAGGWSPAAYNVPNAMLHGLNVVLVFFLARAFGALRGSSAVLPAVLAALLF